MRSPAPVQHGSRFRDVCAALPAAVCVVTGTGSQGLYGATVSSMCSVSLDPLIVLVCLDNRSSTLSAVRESGSFAVNALHAGQDEIASRFASRVDGATKYQGVPHRIQDGVPVLDDALGWFVCDVAEAHLSGDHTILTGLVREVGGGDGEPLLWHRRTFRGLTPQNPPS